METPYSLVDSSQNFVLKVEKTVSIGIAAFMPQVIENGVSPLDLLGVMR